MTRARVGRGLIATTAVATAVVPAVVDGWLLRDAHVGNPRWLPHAKLHGGMSIVGGFGLGGGALAVLATRPAAGRPGAGAAGAPAADRPALAIAAGLATVFWAGLLGSRLVPGASYSIAAGDPAFADRQPPVVLGVPAEPNAVLAVLCLGLGWLGYALASRPRPAADRSPDPDARTSAGGRPDA